MASVSSEYSDVKHILVFANKLLQFQMNYNSVSSYYTLNCKVYVVNEVEQRLEKAENCFENAAQFRFQRKAVILDCNLITIGESQLQIPVILIGKHYNETDKLKLLLLTAVPIENDRLELVYWGVPMKITYANNLDVKLTHGPIIYWLKNQFLYINYLTTTNSRYVTTRITLPDVVSPSILSLKHEYEQISSSSLIITLILIVRTQFSSYMTKILFKPYENSINVQSNTKLKQSAHDKYLSRARSVSFVDDECLNQRFLCSTSDCDLVEFDFDGSVTNINSGIGFTADRMVYYTGQNRTNRYVVVLSQSNTSVIDLNRFEVVKTYKDVTDIFIGSFVRFGTSTHILLITRVQGKDLDESRIRITDIVSDLFTSENTEEVCIEPSLIAAKKALETRCIAGREAVSRNKSQLEHLDRVVNDVCLTLREAAIGHEIRQNEPTTFLYKLLNGEMNDKIECVAIHGTQTLIDDQCCEPLHIGKSWQRIITDKWIIGIEITNLSKGPIWDLHLVLTSKEHELIHSTKLFRMTQYSSLTQAVTKPPRKKFKTHDEDLPFEIENDLESFERAILTTSLDVGILKHKSELSVNIVVTFKRKVNSNVRNCYIKCSPIVLSVDYLLNDKFRTNFEGENDIWELLCDFAAVQAMTNAIEVTLISKETDMHCLKDTIEQSSGFSYIQRLSVFHWNRSECQVLNGVFFDLIRAENKSRAHLITYTKNQSQFFALVHHLYNVLPEDVLILPQSDEETHCTNTNRSLSQEIKFIKDFFEKDFRTIEMDKGQSDLQSLQDIGEIRKVYKDQKRISKEFQTFNVSDYIRFRKDLLLLETKTDKLIISESTIKKS